MNSQPVLKTDEGIVLMSSGGRIIKAAYDFGNAHDIRDSRGNAAILNMYVRCKSPIVNIGDSPFAVMAIMNNSLTQGDYCGFIRFESSSYIASLGVAFRYTDTPALIFNKTLESDYAAGTALRIGGTGMGATRLATFNISKTECQTFKNATINSVVNTSALAFNAESYNFLSIGRSARVAEYYENGTRSVAQFNRLLVFNRFLAAGEHSFCYSNASGSDIQSKQGLILDIIFDHAEILDFSLLQDGSDMRVGCRDYSGYNRHGEIMNLPAGTLQQKCDYANANLFVTFI